MSEFVTTVGLEIHVELTTATKMFCGCPVAFGGEPNTRVCPICLGLPGTLPVPNEKAIELTTKIAQALGCDIAPKAIFHRKNYFYPDMPKNYQISQYDIPIGFRGHLGVQLNGEVREVGITRVHLEEDTGKTVHAGEGGRIHKADYALEDFNRAGTPLVEIVTEPDLRSADEARAFAQELRTILEYLGVSDVRMEEGSLRIDANISVAREGEEGIKAEVKNMNSMRSLHRALAYEEQRQRKVLEEGGEMEQATRHWDEEAGVTRPGRLKEYSSDYRYFPEPDLVPIEPQVEWLRQLQEEIPELPSGRRARLLEEGLTPQDASVLTTSKAIGDFFDQASAAAKEADAKQVANWITNVLVGLLDDSSDGFAGLEVTPRDLAGLVDLVSKGDISAAQAKEVLTEMVATGKAPQEIVQERGLEQVSDRGELEGIVEKVISENADAAEKVRAGDQAPLNHLLGQVMRATKGQANPGVVREVLQEKLQ